MPSSLPKLKILSQNCNKSHEAYVQLKLNMSSLSADLVCIQEPYSPSNLPNLFTFNPILYFTSSPTQSSYSAICVCNKNLTTTHITKYSNRFITTISVQIRNSTVILVNIYFLPNDPNLETHLSILSNLLTDPDFQNLAIIFTGDLNARHINWHDHYTNRQGRNLFDLITSHALAMHNGNSIIDLTLTNIAATPLVLDWKVGEEDSDSDHELISFSLDLNPPSSFEYFDSTWKFFENDKSNWANYFDQIDTSSLSLLSADSTSTAIDHSIQQLELTLINAAYKSLAIRTVSNRKRKQSTRWWNDRLALLKSAIKQMKTKIHKTDNAFWKDRFKRELNSIRKEYRKQIKSKSNSTKTSPGVSS